MILTSTDIIILPQKLNNIINQIKQGIQKNYVISKSNHTFI